MANTPYPLAMAAMLRGDVSLQNADLRAVLVSDDYAFASHHDSMTEVAGFVVGQPRLLVNVSTSGGVLDADDIDFGTIDPGDTVAALVVYIDTGVASTSTPLLFLDEVPGVPFATSGGEVSIPWNDGPDKIMRIVAPFYSSAAQSFMRGQSNLLSGGWEVALVGPSYAFDRAHTSMADLGGAVVGSPKTLTGVSVDGGVLDADDPDFGAIAPGADLRGLVIYKAGMTPESSNLLLYTSDVTGFPAPTTGAGVKVRWSDGPAKIASLIPA